MKNRLLNWLKLFSVEGPLESDTNIEDVRNKIILWVAYLFAILCLPAAIAGTYKNIEAGRTGFSLFYISAYMVAVLGVLFGHKVTYRVQIAMMVAAIYGFASVILFKFALSGAGIWMLLTLCILGSVLVNMRFGFVLLAMSIALILFAGALISTDIVKFEADVIFNSVTMTSWVLAAIVFFALAMATIVTPGLLNLYLQRALEENQLRADELERTNRLLLKEIQEREIAQRERDHFEDELRQSQKLEAIGRLAGGVAHDFNNILTSIVGNVEMARIDYERGKSPDESLNEIDTAAERAAALTKRLLAFSRKQAIELAAVNLPDLISGSYKMLSRLIGEDIDLDTELPHYEILVMADQFQIDQILLNLAVNARDAMPKGGRLSISLAETMIDERKAERLALTKTGPYAEIAVVDTGQGMDQETRERVFEPFFTTKDPDKGTGLGLSTVYGIVKQHNGAVEVESQPGAGSTFRIYIPVCDESQKKSGICQPCKTLPTGSETILLVEDDAMVMKTTKNLLERLKYKVLTADDGADALELEVNYSGEIDLLITDVVMPKINGKQLVERFRERRPDTPVLFVSGYAGSILTQYGEIENSDNFLPKPYSAEKIAQRIRKLLSPS